MTNINIEIKKSHCKYFTDNSAQLHVWGFRSHHAENFVVALRDIIIIIINGVVVAVIEVAQ